MIHHVGKKWWPNEFASDVCYQKETTGDNRATQTRFNVIITSLYGSVCMRGLNAAHSRSYVHVCGIIVIIFEACDTLQSIFCIFMLFSVLIHVGFTQYYCKYSQACATDSVTWCDTSFRVCICFQQVWLDFNSPQPFKPWKLPIHGIFRYNALKPIGIVLDPWPSQFALRIWSEQVTQFLMCEKMCNTVYQ